MKFRLGYGWFQENILQTDLEGEKILAWKYLVKKKFPHWKKKIFQSVWSWKKILTPFYARKKILSPEVWEKNWIMYLLGDCWSMYWPTSWSTIDRYTGHFVSRYLVDSQPIWWRHSVATVYQSIVGQYFANGYLGRHVGRSVGRHVSRWIGRVAV